MKDIKFRAWDTETKTMLDRDAGYFVEFDGSIWFNCGDGYNDALQSQDNIILMQYTGLKDKNGVEIYEGDICDFIIGNQSPSKGTRHKIIWLRCAWGFQPLFPGLVHIDDREPRAFYVDPFEGDDWDANDFSVIGNIHENPELLE